jgi:hypothetical protein
MSGRAALSHEAQAQRCLYGGLVVDHQPTEDEARATARALGSDIRRAASRLSQPDLVQLSEARRSRQASTIRPQPFSRSSSSCSWLVSVSVISVSMDPI